MAEKETLQLKVLKTLEEAFASTPCVDSLSLSKNLNLSHNDTVGLLKSLEMMQKIETSSSTHVCWATTEEGNEYAKCGTPEFRLVAYLKSVGSVGADELRAGEKWKALGLNVLLKNKWASSVGGQVSLAADSAIPGEDTVQKILKTVATSSEGEEGSLVESGKLTAADLVGLSKRKLLTRSQFTVFSVKKTAEFSTEIQKLETELTRDMLLNGTWKEAQFKPYNFDAAGLAPTSGSIHPLVQTLNEFRSILVQMGFEEMPTRRWVESSFWNFDALFQPQTHPVRDAHDTFFMKSPESHQIPTEKNDSDYFYRVKEMHESGDEQSLGWQCSWSEQESCKLLLRTHTTAISSQMLKHMGDEFKRSGNFVPKKFFSIDRVFRNETLDATHLAEFHQVEGVVASRDASLAKLMGVIAAFFGKIGITHIKFKPAYNPYTEPSMEIFGYHPQLQKWTEIGNSGVFRPEMLRPMGLPDDVVVLGWGLSLERPTMISNQVADIRELFGPKAKLSVF